MLTRPRPHRRVRPDLQKEGDAAIVIERVRAELEAHSRGG
jgi:hypothetical protein